MHLAGTVIGRKRTNLAKNPCDDRVVGDAKPPRICIERSMTRQIASEQIT